MKKIPALIFLLVIMANFLFAQETKSVKVTVYNSNLGVVKEIRSVDIPEGLSSISITDVAQYIDPTSVHIKLKGTVLEQNYQYDLVSMNKILQKYIDKEIELISEKGELIEGTLLSSYGNQTVIKKKEGGLLLLPDISDYRFSVGALPEGLITRPTLVWQVKSKDSGKQDVEVSYQTSGMNWHAEYVAVLNEDDTKLDLNSWVSVENNSGTTFKNAKLKLVAGDVNMVKERGYGVRKSAMLMENMVLDAEAPQFVEQEFFEYHIYNLQRPSTISNSETKQISLFQSENVSAEKRYLYKSGDYYGGSEKKVQVIVEFENKENNNLGMPMPKGKVRVFKSDGDDMEFVGEDLIDHTPRNEKIKLKIGDAFDIVAKEKQTENKKISNKVYDKTFEITIKNRKKEDIVVDVEKILGSFWEIKSSTFKFEKIDASKVLFKVPVKENDETVLEIKVRYRY